MTRMFLTLSLVVSLFAVGCGGGKDSSNDSGNSGNANAFAKASSLPAEQQSQIGIQVNLAEFMKSPVGKSMLEEQEDVPAFVYAMTNLVANVSLPSKFSENMEGINFYARLDYATENDAKAGFADFSEGGMEDVEINGKTYKKISDGSGPTAFVRLDGKSMTFESEDYAKSDSKSFASEGLVQIMSGLPEEPFKMGFDMAGAKEFVDSAIAQAPPADKMVKAIIDNVKKLTAMKATGGMGDTFFMLAFDSEDEKSAKGVKQQLQLGVGFLAGFAAMAAPDEKEAPALSEMFNHVLTSLTPKQEGNTTMIEITKPENYSELEAKIPGELKKLSESGGMLGGGPGGFGPGGPGGPGGFGPGGPGGPDFGPGGPGGPGGGEKKQ